MPKTEPKQKKKRGAGGWLNMSEPERFEKIEAVFSKRGVPGLSIVGKIRIVIDEWLRANGGK